MDANLAAAHLQAELAREALKAAELLVANGLARSSIDRSYYAAFHAASALLASRGIFPGSHDGVIAMLALHFVKAGALPKGAGRDLQRLQDQRLIADYKGYLDIQPRQAPLPRMQPQGGMMRVRFEQFHGFRTLPQQLRVTLDEAHLHSGEKRPDLEAQSIGTPRRPC
jgi:uncharacterized protein (UPF0332 family)